MSTSKTSRLLALFAVAVLLVAGACNRGNNDDDETETTEPPERTPSVEAVADFQLVGSIDEAFAGQLPPVDVPEGETTPDTTDAPLATGSPSTTGSPSLTPAGTPVGETPTRGGILRIALDAASQDLTDACGVGEGSVVHVFWTTNTFFDPPDVLDDVEDEIEDRTAGISGTIFRTSGLDTDGDAIDTPIPTSASTGSPATTTTPAATGGSPTPSVQAADCLLVAEQVGFGQTSLPTPRPVTRRTATPATTAPTATPSPTVTPTASPTGSPGTPTPGTPTPTT